MNLDNLTHRSQGDFCNISLLGNSAASGNSADQASKTMSRVANSFPLNPISQNDKSLTAHLDLDRFSEIVARNQQNKPHLKSSYAIEGIPPTVTGSQERGDKENASLSSKKSNRDRRSPRKVVFKS